MGNGRESPQKSQVRSVDRGPQSTGGVISSYIDSCMFIMSIDVSHAMCAVCIDILPCFSWQILKIFASESRIPAFHRLRLPWAWEPAGGEIAPKSQVRSADWGPQSTGGCYIELCRFLHVYYVHRRLPRDVHRMYRYTSMFLVANSKK